MSCEQNRYEQNEVCSPVQKYKKWKLKKYGRAIGKIILNKKRSLADEEGNI